MEQFYIKILTFENLGTLFRMLKKKGQRRRYALYYFAWGVLSMITILNAAFLITQKIIDNYGIGAVYFGSVVVSLSLCWILNFLIYVLKMDNLSRQIKEISKDFPKTIQGTF